MQASLAAEDAVPLVSTASHPLLQEASDADRRSRRRRRIEDPEHDFLPLSLNDILYASESFMAVLKPVALTLVCAAITTVAVHTTSSLAQQKATEEAYEVFDDDDTTDDSSSVRFGKALINAIVMILVIALATFGIVLLYKFRCMKCLVGYMMFSSTLLLGLMGGVVWYTACDKWQVPIDVYTFLIVLYNFAAVGVIAIFYPTGIPTIVTQGYLVATSVIMAWQLSRFDEWTGWCLLVMLALYDLCAVLTPCGPLKALVNLMQEYGEPMPGLLYEAELPTSTPPTAEASGGGGAAGGGRRDGSGASRGANSNGGSRSGGGGGGDGASHAEGAGRSAGAAAGAKTRPERAQRKSKRDRNGARTAAERRPLQAAGDSTAPRQLARSAAAPPSSPPQGAGASATGPAGLQGAQQDRQQDGGCGGRGSSSDGCGSSCGGAGGGSRSGGEGGGGSSGEELRPLVPLELHVHAEVGAVEFVFEEHGATGGDIGGSGSGGGGGHHRRGGGASHHSGGGDEDDGGDRSIKLGLGDFIFYSVLVSKAALYGFATSAVCFVVILFGLSVTLGLLGLYRAALPALPISISLGVVFYLATRFSIQPYVEHLASVPIYL